MAHVRLSDRPMIRKSSPDSGAVGTGDAANYVFETRMLRVLVSNRTSDVVLYKVTDTPGSDEATTTDYDGIVSSGETVDVSLDGLRGVTGVSLWVVNGAGNGIQVVGLPATA